MQKIKILKVEFDKVTLKEATKTIQQWLNQDKQRQIVTPNPEILLQAQENQKFLKILNKADLSIADGIGILWASTYLAQIQNVKSTFIKLFIFKKTLLQTIFTPNKVRKILPQRVTGVDLMEAICKKSGQQRIFLLGATKAIGEKTAEILQKKYSKIKITGTYSGSTSESEENKIIDEINKQSPKILFVAFGAPKQELWIARNLHKLKTVKVAMGVGGAFDFISGAKKRAPRFMQKTGTEWIYRLIQEPKRFKRILNATIKFPKTVLLKTINKPKISSIVTW